MQVFWPFWKMLKFFSLSYRYTSYSPFFAASLIFKPVNVYKEYENHYKF